MAKNFHNSVFNKKELSKEVSESWTMINALATLFYHQMNVVWCSRRFRDLEVAEERLERFE
ncbi:hypothetical protein HI914_06799 [Erysiphe necator]|nr:hypothetical protein HI914_06799 [Erysiphe necator]